LALFLDAAPVAQFFAEIGKLLLMFFAGLEIDLSQFRRTGTRSLVFGALTFSTPFITGIGVGLLAGYGWLTAVLIGSIIASHTLLGFPNNKKGMHLFSRSFFLPEAARFGHLDLAENRPRRVLEAECGRSQELRPGRCYTHRLSPSQRTGSAGSSRSARASRMREPRNRRAA
jgi:hypothetical protein